MNQQKLQLNYEEVHKMLMYYIGAIKKRSASKPVTEVVDNIIAYELKISKLKKNFMQFLTTKEICVIYKISKQQLHQSKIKPVKIDPKKFLWNAGEVLEWRDKQVELEKMKKEKRKKGKKGKKKGE